MRPSNLLPDTGFSRMDPARAAAALAIARRRENPDRIYLCDIPADLRDELFAALNTWIAAVVGCTPSAVVQYREGHDIPPAAGRGGPPRPGRERWIEDMKRRLAAPGNP